MHVIQLQHELLAPPEYATTFCRRSQPWASTDSLKQPAGATLKCEVNIDRATSQQYKESSREDISRYNLILGVLSITRSKSKNSVAKARSKFGSSKIEKLIFQPNITRYLQRSFSLLCEHSFGAWQISLRTFSHFTTDDPIYQCCVSGDLYEAKELCNAGYASPFAVTQDGYTLLHVRYSYDRVR